MALLKIDNDCRSWSFGKLKKVNSCIFVDGKKYAVSTADQCNVREKAKEALELKLSFTNPCFDWLMSFNVSQKDTCMMINSQVYNRSDKAIELGECRMIELEAKAGGGLELGPDPDRQMLFRYIDGSMTNQYVKPIASKKLDNDTNLFCHIHNPDSGKTLFAGFTTLERMNFKHHVDYRRGRGLKNYYSACDFNGFKLLPGESIKSEELMVRFSSSPYECLEDWAARIRKTYPPRLPAKVSAGWLGCSWVDNFTLDDKPHDITDRNTRAIRKRLRGFDIDYIWISISNLKDGLPGNWLKFNNERYPEGFDKTLKMIISRGFKPGLWVAPFWLCEGSEGLEENRNNLALIEGTGKADIRGAWPWAFNAEDGKLPGIGRLDTTHENSIKYLEKIFSEYRAMGISYYMLDFLGNGAQRPEHAMRNHLMIKGFEGYGNCMRAIRKTAGDETHLLSAIGSSVRNAGIVNSSRIALDYGEGLQMLPHFPSYPATYLVNIENADASYLNVLRNMAACFFAHGNFYLNNINLMTVDKPVPLNEAQICATLFGLSGSPLMLGDDIASIEESRLALIKKVLPRTADSARSADLFKRIYPDYPRVLYVPVDTTWGKWTVAGFFNGAECCQRIDIDLSDLKLDANCEYTLYDFWAEQYCGIHKGKTLTIEVPAHSCRLLRLAENTDHPWILSTDMHVRQGQVELSRVKWNAKSLTLSGEAIRPAGEHGNIFVIAPMGFRPLDYPGIFAAKDFRGGRNGMIIIRKALDFGSGPLKWKLSFRRMSEKEIRGL